MPLRAQKPTSPGQRGMSRLTFDELSNVAPLKSLLRPKTQKAGRNKAGRVTVRHRGGGVRRNYRIIDFKRDKTEVPAKVATLEYDPNRSAYIALLHYVDGEKRYIIAPQGIKVGDTVVAGEKAEIRLGNALPMASIPVGTLVHNVELSRGKGGQIVRSAGAGAQLMAKEKDYALLRLPSGELRRVHASNFASIGQVSNIEHENVSSGKAGRTRWLGRRPSVRGSAMNPVDHPHGGGEGKAPIGLPGPKTPWGKPALGHKTRTRKISNKLILKRRGGGR